MNDSHPKCERCGVNEAWFHVLDKRCCADCLTDDENAVFAAARIEAELQPRDIVEPFGGNI